ncbi:hypothetical protein RDWZM_004575 [Blomia tropicalis]|uniref:Uncharacterized protein n=1 Tax=Blomia tropicalis TaxID=40697 RepID=A0A9Q0M2B6_BLOTA|nr:hypothetical protein RDWZM_004575 [Blomia tropicalis]
MPDTWISYVKNGKRSTKKKVKNIELGQCITSSPPTPPSPTQMGNWPPPSSSSESPSSSRRSSSPNNVCIRSSIKTKNPIRLDQLERYYVNNSRDSNLGFSNEYLMLERLCKETVYKQLTQIRYQASKNRFANVMPYEHSLVRLKPIPNIDGSDYINASFVPGIHSDREYIACQAPLRDTLDDFYRMILEHKVPIVVNLLERENPSYFPSFVGDDDQMERKIYLPDATEEVQLLNMMARNNEHDHDNQINGLINEQMIKRIQIKLHQVEQRECYQIKQIHFINNDSIIHRVSQFHYNKWIDFGTPDNVKSLIELIHDVRTFISINSQNMMIRNAPIVVHCNAGIGRTGTYIAVDQLWQTLTNQWHKLGSSSSTNNSSEWGHKLVINLLKLHNTKPTIDIYGLVYRLRNWRHGLVQNENQYAFIYECVRYISKHRAEIITNHRSSGNVHHNHHHSNNVEMKQIDKCKTTTKHNCEQLNKL